MSILAAIGPVWVPGDPKGQPRPRAFSRGGHARCYDPGTAEGWKSQIAEAMRPHIPTLPLFGPIQVTIAFYMRRPKSHYGKRGLKPTAPTWHAQKPDCDNALKAALDALTLLRVWNDDAQVAQALVSRRWENGNGPGASISILQLEP